MQKFNNHELYTLGVVNATPNSFSDPAKTLDANFKNVLTDLIQSSDMIDIGAESTAPMNSGITEDEEILRLKEFLNLFHAQIVPLKALSLDTYKSGTIFWAQEYLMHLGFHGTLVWNDVSGVMDDAVEKFLRLSSKHIYVHTFNNLAKREDTPEHDKHHFLETNLAQLCVNNFCKIVEKFPQYSKNIWLDPGFGFAKNIEQNQLLWSMLPQIMQQFKDHNWVIGISRKRFIRDEKTQNPRDFHSQKILDQKMLQMFNDLLSALSHPQKIWARVHEPAIFRIPE